MVWLQDTSEDEHNNRHAANGVGPRPPLLARVRALVPPLLQRLDDVMVLHADESLPRGMLNHALRTIDGFHDSPAAESPGSRGFGTGSSEPDTWFQLHNLLTGVDQELVELGQTWLFELFVAAADAHLAAHKGDFGHLALFGAL